MAERAGPDGTGTVVARGKIKVDARKAISKLRDHLLVDLHLYSTEIARVAVAMGASSLAVEWDADDVIMTFDGRTLDIQAVSRARDHVLTPESDVADGDALRVLGIGVSAALGLDPSFVDVIVAEPSRCARVRFEAKHIDEDVSAAAPSPHEHPRPRDMPCPGMRVHVRRRVGLEILARAVRRDVPREIGLLTLATRDAPLVVTVNGAPAERPPAPAVLVRVDLDEPAATRAVLEVLALSRGPGARTCFLDRGVHLAESAGIGLPALDEGALPLRVLVDAKSLPTNASRSEVRMDAEIVTRIRERIPAALEAALNVLERVAVRDAVLQKGPITLKTGHSVEVINGERELHEESLGAIAAEVAIALQAGKKVVPAEAALLHLPLLRSAVGLPMTLAQLRGGTDQRPLLVYSGEEPAPRDLEPWLRDVVWQRGRAVERALARLTQTSANERVALAREGQTRRLRALEHPASRPILPASSAYLLKEAFAVSEGPFAGLEGEVAVVKRESGYRRASTARLFVDQRLLQTMQLPGVALPVDMALAWPSGIKAQLSYDGVWQDERVTKALVYALRVAAMAVCERLGPRDPELARLAILACASATQQLGDATPSRAGLGNLALQAVWPATDGTFLTLAAIDAYANRSGALCTGPPASGPAVDGRPVIVAEHARALLGLLTGKKILVDYSGWLGQPKSAATHALALQALTSPVRVPIARKNIEGFVGVGANRKRIFHGGTLLSDEAFAYRNGPVLVALEDRGAMPAGNLRELLWSSPDVTDLRREEDALLDQVVDGCERGDIDRALVEDYLAPVLRKLVDRLNALRATDDLVWTAAMVKRLEEMPALLERTRLARAKAAVLARPVKLWPAEGPSASVVKGSGTVTARLMRGPGAESVPGEVLFQGHPLESPSKDFTAFYILLVIDVTKEDFVKDWSSLTDEGKRWAQENAAAATLKLLGELARGDGFASDFEALRICESLVESDEALASRVALLLNTARWPTVQGGTTTLAAAGQVPFGSESFAPYRTTNEISPYDAPAIHLAPGALSDLKRRLLARAGFTLLDVTAPIARLQKLRARAAQGHAPPPQLGGVAAHPELRASLGKLGATLVEGELELIDGTMSEIARVDARGATHPFFFALDFPVRVVFRAGEASEEQLRGEIAVATIRHLRALGGIVDELPAFVRDRVRKIVCQGVLHGHRGPADDTHAVFLDKDGASWSLARLVELGTVRRTRDPGPWSVPMADGPILRISDEEAHALAAVLRFEDMTAALREAQRGHERRSSAALATIELPPDLRAQCMFTVAFDEDGARGEIGLLRPAHARRRGIAVYTTKRLLTAIEDGGAWPIAAAIDIDGLEPTRGFDGIQQRPEIGRIQRRVRATLSAHAVQILPAPPDAIGVLRMPVPFMVAPEAGSAGLAVACIGVFWLTPEWPEAPSVHLEGIDFVAPFIVPRIAAARTARHRVLPVSGKLWICADQKHIGYPLERAFGFVFDRLSPMLTSASRQMRSAAPEQREAYIWDLRLLGARTDVDPVKELANDRPNAILMRVAARRAPYLIDAATGDAPKGATPLPAEPALVMSNAAVGEEPPEAEPASISDLDVPVGETFLRGLVRRIVELVTPAPEKIRQTPLTASLAGALAAMKLTGDPVAQVVESSRGRPVRYELRTKRVVVNAKHASVCALEDNPARVLHLLAAAVSEINRELVPVTDAEELAVIVDLLREG